MPLQTDRRYLEFMTLFNRIHNRYAAVKRLLVVNVDGGSDLHPAEMHVLLVVVQKGDITPGAVAEALHITPSAVSQHLRALSRGGYVTRLRPQDNERSVILAATDSGHRAVNAFLSRQSTVFGAFLETLSSWPENDQAVVGRFLQAVDGMLGKKLT